MKAIFIGKTSRGFKTGKMYDIKTKCEVVKVRGKEQCCLCVYDTSTFTWCPYSNLEKFLENWFLLYAVRKG